MVEKTMDNRHLFVLIYSTFKVFRGCSRMTMFVFTIVPMQAFALVVEKTVLSLPIHSLRVHWFLHPELLLVPLAFHTGGLGRSLSKLQKNIV